MKKSIHTLFITLTLISNFSLANEPSNTEVSYSKKEKATDFLWSKTNDIKVKDDKVGFGAFLKFHVPDSRKESAFAEMTIAYLNLHKKNADMTCEANLTVDGERLVLDDVDSGYSDAHKAQYINIFLNADNLRNLYQANSLTISMCSSEFTLTPEELTDLKKTINKASEKMCNKTCE